MRSPHQGTGVGTDVVRPQHDCEYASPKAQVQESDSEEPSSEPQAPHQTVLLDSYFLQFICVVIRFQDSLLQSLLRVWVWSTVPLCLAGGVLMSTSSLTSEIVLLWARLVTTHAGGSECTFAAFSHSILNSSPMHIMAFAGMESSFFGARSSDLQAGTCKPEVTG